MQKKNRNPARGGLKIVCYLDSSGEQVGQKWKVLKPVALCSVYIFSYIAVVWWFLGVGEGKYWGLIQFYKKILTVPGKGVVTLHPNVDLANTYTVWQLTAPYTSLEEAISF